MNEAKKEVIKIIVQDDTPPEPQPRRLRKLAFAPRLLLTLGRGICQIVENPIPEGAEIRGIQYDPVTDTVSIVIEHESFDLIPVGDIIPFHPTPKVKRIQVKDE